MLNPSDGTAKALRYLIEGTASICVAFASIVLLEWSLVQMAMARFWEPWVKRFGVLGSEIPFALVAFSLGLALGAIIGLAFGRRALFVAVLAGALSLIMWLIGAATYPEDGSFLLWTVIHASTLVVGLVMGSICARRIRHA